MRAGRRAYRAEEWKDVFRDEAAVETEQKDTRVRQHASGQDDVIHVRTRHLDVSATVTPAASAAALRSASLPTRKTGARYYVSDVLACNKLTKAPLLFSAFH